MHKHLLTLLASITIATSAVFAHGDVEIGPNGGRILEFSKDETMHGEVTVQDGKFHVGLLNKALKPVAFAAQTLNASGGPTGKPEKLAVEKSGTRFVVPLVKPGEWLILQFRETAGSKAVTARLHYDTKPCGECKAEEWLCKCAAEKR